MLAVSFQSMIGYAVPAVIVIILILVIAMGYVKAPPDRAFIISGLMKEPKILIGRAGIRIPFFVSLCLIIFPHPIHCVTQKKPNGFPCRYSH